MMRVLRARNSNKKIKKLACRMFNTSFKNDKKLTQLKSFVLSLVVQSITSLCTTPQNGPNYDPPIFSLL